MTADEVKRFVLGVCLCEKAFSTVFLNQRKNGREKRKQNERNEFGSVVCCVKIKSCV